MGNFVDEQKRREREFREKDISFGSFTIKNKTRWWNAVELRPLVKGLSLTKDAVLLDAGCSDGRLHDAMSVGKVAYAGIDFALKPLKELREKSPDVWTVCADITQLPFKRGIFDAVCSVQVVQQLPSSEQRLKALRRFHEVLKPKGRCAVSVLNQESWKDLVHNGKEGPLITAPDLYVYLYSAQELRGDLEAAGFRVEKVGATNMLPVRWLKPLRGFGVMADVVLSQLLPSLCLRRGRYLFAVCVKD